MAAALTFGSWVKRRRRTLGLTQKELAYRIGYAVVTLRKLEADELRPSRQMAAKLAAALDLAPAEAAQFVRFARDEAHWDDIALPAQVTLPPIPPTTVPSEALPALVDQAPPDSAVVAVPQAIDTHSPGHAASQKPFIPFVVTARRDWGEAPDVSRFHGRHDELAQLCQWLADDQCRLVAVLGMGGIGKTALATLAASTVQDAFSVVVWRSLRNGPPLGELLGQVIETVAGGTEYELPLSVEHRIALLLDYLRGQRCLLVFDNFETILQGERTGHYLEGFEAYGELLRQVGQGRHQSCLLLTSREKPKELVPLAGDTMAVRAMSLPSMPTADARDLLQERDLQATDENWTILNQRYSGNPLALQIVAETIRELFHGDIAEFLAEDMLLFSGINDLLEQQFVRLSPLEQEVMYWLAAEREPVTWAELSADIVQTPARSTLLHALHCLRQRSLVEQVQNGFTLQNVVLEYVTAILIEQVCGELRGGHVALLQRVALLKASAKSYVRESQRNLVLGPIAQQLVADLGPIMLVDLLGKILARMRSSQGPRSGYAGGNILNMLVQLGVDLRGWNFSQLSVWQADLRDIAAQDINFQQSNLRGSAFAESFADVYRVVLSPNGRQLAVGTVEGEIRIWQISDSTPILTWAAHQGVVWSVAFSPSGNLLASASADRTVRLWDARDARLLATLAGHTDDVFTVTFNSDGSLLASSSDDDSVRLWDPNTGACLHMLDIPSALAISFSPDGGMLATAGDDHMVRLWDWRSGVCLRAMRGHLAAVSSLAFSPDGSMLASGSADMKVQLWHTDTGVCLRTLDGHHGWVRSVSFSPDGRLLASGSDDHMVRLWNAHTGACLHVLAGHTDWIRSVCFGADGAVLASGGDDQTVRLWNGHSGQCLQVLRGRTYGIWSMCVSPDGSLVACASDVHVVQVWNLHTGDCLHTVPRHVGNNICSVAFSPDGQLLASSDADTVKLWNTHTWECIYTLDTSDIVVLPLCFSADSAIFASGGNGNSVQLWSVQTGDILHTLLGHTSYVRAMCFSSEGHLVATGSQDQTVRLWDRGTGRCRHTLRGHTGWVWSVCFNPAGTALASSGDQTVRLWDTHTGECMHVLSGHTGKISTVTFSLDGSMLASCSADGTVRLWDPHSGRIIHTLAGHTDNVYSACFAKQGGTLASCSADGTVRLWDPYSGECRHVLQGHLSTVTSISFSLDGEVLVSVSTDGTLRVWDAGTGECLMVRRGDRPYERMRIAGATGLTAAQLAALRRLGAVG